ncbi:myosin heavy chain, cardiac muscle isoform-like [Phoenix dactylifera]|uniref:Myosin heavy chain, cardiac muscle isoform-like n=1 Tax=Phoenix dactylifera TaxID=42345 RepID=A0A8B7MWP2_PHODC|nr:myosin heavy chain, cardiac muscle isoform-like [Phoenix dactylifera]
MFKLHRHRSDRLGDRIEFKFSNFQAFQVPKGWDRLFLSIISVETGKTIAKSSKTTVHGGTCQWTETLSESVFVSQNDASKELEECQFKIVVSMGSARSGILGEVTLNLTDYLSSRDSGSLSLPLKKCNYGTILQLRIQCATPKSKSRDRKSWRETSHLEDLNANNDDMENKSDGSDHMFNRRLVSSTSNNMGTNPDEPGNRDRSFSASGSHRSSDSGDSSIGRTTFSPRNSSNGGVYMGRQDSTDSHVSSTYSAGPGDDISKSNQSSFNSRASGSSLNTNQWQETAAQTSMNGLAPLSVRPSDSAKDLLEAAEETIEELRDEAKMWERHSRKLKLDIEKLKKECSDKSKHHTELEMELSAAYTERDSLRQEVEHVKSSLDELMTKQTNTDTGSAKIESMIHVQKELEDEVKFQKESNANLTLQLKKTQESNIELVSILQEVEEISEKQRLEIENLTKQNNVSELDGDLRSPAMSETDVEWRRKLSLKEEEIIKLEEKLSDVLNAQHSEMVSGESHSDLIREIEVLKAKVQELEKDCAELTDENLELIFKVKELSKDIKEGKDFHGSSSPESQDNNSPDNIESETDLLKSHICHLEEELKRKEMSTEGYMVESSAAMLNDLKKRCADLEFELQQFKDQACDLEIKLQKSRADIEEKNLELTELQQKLENFHHADLGSFDIVTERRETESWSTSEMPRLFFEMNKQLHMALSHVRSGCCDGNSVANREFVSDPDFKVPITTDTITVKEQAVVMKNLLLELNELLRGCKFIFQHTDVMVENGGVDSTEIEEQQKNKSLLEQEIENLKEEMHSRSKGINKELEESNSKIEELKAGMLFKEKETDILKHSKRGLEDLISNLQKDKSQVEEDLATAHRENSMTLKCLEDVRHDLMELTSTIESHISANKILERKSIELESCKNELELHISEMEQENVQLSERISGLEAQLRHLTNEKESKRLELEDSRSLIVDLKDEIEKKQAEMETQKVELKQKLQESQKRLLEAKEEAEVLRRSRSKLQSTVESLIEECSSLQKLTEDLRRQKLELHEHITHLEIELDESQTKSSDFCKKVQFLEVKLSSLQKDIASKETSLLSELESIFQEHKEHEEGLRQAHIMLDKIQSEKTVEVENLEREIAHLTAQVSSTHDEQERAALDAVHEVSSLRSDKAKLECSLQEVNEKVKLYETELQTLRQESKNKVHGLVDLLNASKQSEEMLMTDIKHMQRLMEDVKSSEEKYKRMANELELKLKASDYEKQQTMEEISRLEVQLQKIAHLQDEILVLKSSLDEAKFEKGKLEELLRSVTEECEELKTEKVSLKEKVANMQKAFYDGEDDRRSRIALEEKLLRLESDLIAKEASYAYEAELKNELNRIKRTNSEYQRKIQSFAQEKDELMRKAQLIEREVMPNNDQSRDDKVSSESGMERHTSEHHEMERRAQNSQKRDKHFNASEQKISGENELRDHMERPQVSKEVDLESKVHLLENRLAEALETKNMYKVQLQRFIDEEGKNQTEVLNKTTSNNDTKISNNDKISSLEVELKDMQERYLQMSLQYAEVEAQREELVMKLKSMKKEKRWFS